MNRKYTEEHIEFLRDNVKGISLKELTQRFNKKFACNVSETSIHELKKRKKMKSGVKTKARKGFAVGTERFDEKGYVEIKVSDKKWMKKSRYVYEQVYGKIPEGHSIVFADGDKQNFDLDNLILMTNSEKWIMNLHKLYKKDKELMKTVSLLVKVMDKLNKRKEK